MGFIRRLMGMSDAISDDALRAQNAMKRIADTMELAADRICERFSLADNSPVAIQDRETETDAKPPGKSKAKAHAS